MSDDKEMAGRGPDADDRSEGPGASVFPTKEAADGEAKEIDADEQVHTMREELPKADKETDVDDEIHKRPNVAPDPGSETDIDDLVHRK